jgi:NADH-quinone oxidoreductase subunit J
VEAVVFFVCAAMILTGALGVVLSRNPVHSALWLLLTLCNVAVMFLQLHAALVAAVQIVVYASAIIVLFLFVITLLGVDQHESLQDPRRFQRPAAIVLGALVFIQVILIAGHHWATGAVQPKGTPDAPNYQSLDAVRTGNVERLARSLFTTYIWAFEITAVLLVIAVVGGVVLARRSGQHHSQGTAVRT